ncbi:hypothetical protein EF888_06545 [Silicimonas algicola]|uniref:Uncharacterized protein n=1 Tax=Silicimonas algicola TaxID=1826607 RepID=A0A316GKB1_9RHOB|nr:hypothetical protein [Silicimonas algicola]AZQ66828.1 hypothetical protein EF888_06545 [Silicimonas algicola]PWK55267.1 hypothetical protein C8D95_108146 [Silicimonas algicola]
MTGIVSYGDIAVATRRSISSVNMFSALSRPKSMPYKGIKLNGSHLPTRFYDIENVVSWLWTAYAHMDNVTERNLRTLALQNAEAYGDV